MPQIVFWKQSIEKKKKWIGISLLVLALSVLVTGILFRQAVADVKIDLQGMIAVPGLQEQYEHYKTKEEIYKVLRNSGIELGDAMEVAK